MPICAIHGGTLYDVEGGVEADIVGQVQRAHGVPRAQLHAHVYVGDSCVASVNHGHGLDQERDKQSIDNEAGRV